MLPSCKSRNKHAVVSGYSSPPHSSIGRSLVLGTSKCSCKNMTLGKTHQGVKCRFTSFWLFLIKPLPESCNFWNYLLHSLYLIYTTRSSPPSFLPLVPDVERPFVKLNLILKIDIHVHGNHTSFQPLDLQLVNPWDCSVNDSRVWVYKLHCFLGQVLGMWGNCDTLWLFL